jgi:predicted kinase
MKAVILRGLPGAGKSTWAKKNAPKAVVCSADDFFMRDGAYIFNPYLLPRAHGACLRKFVDCVQLSEELVVVDNTNIYVCHLAPYISLAEAYGYEVEVRTLDIDTGTSFSRNIHGCPRLNIERMAAGFELLPRQWSRYETLTKTADKA